MRGALDEVTLVKVVGFDPAKEEFMNERPLHLHAVVDSLEEDGLISQRDTRISQVPEAFPDFGGQLTGMVAMDRDEEGMMLLQDIT